MLEVPLERLYEGTVLTWAEKTAHPLDPNLEKTSCFVFPIINGKIVAFQRGTKPHKGKYGPVGEKVEKYDPSNRRDIYWEIIKPGEHKVPCLTDRALMANGLESSFSAGIRGLEEEVFKGEKLDPERIPHHYKIGDVIDTFNKIRFENIIYFAVINTDKTIEEIRSNLTPRELTDAKPVAELNEQELYPIALISLFALKLMLESEQYMSSVRAGFLFRNGLYEQLPRLSFDAVRDAYICHAGVMPNFESSRIEIPERPAVQTGIEILLETFLRSARRKIISISSIEIYKSPKIERLDLIIPYSRNLGQSDICDVSSINMPVTLHLTRAIIARDWEVLDVFDAFKTDPKTGERYI